MGSKFVAYFLWATLGLFGAHHFYLRRYRHGFVWLCTLGGFFVGWMRDFFVLGRYVMEANEDKSYYKQLLDDSVEYPKPRSSWFRLTGQVTMGIFLAVIFRSSIPEDRITEPKETMDHVLRLLVYVTPVAMAIGIHLVGNIGHHRMAFKHCVLTCAAVSVVLSIDDSAWYVASITSFVANKYGKAWSLPSAMLTEWERKYDQETNGQEAGEAENEVTSQSRKKGKPGAANRLRVKRPHLRRFAKEQISRKMAAVLVIVCFSFFVALCVSSIWFNAYVTTDDGEKVLVREAVAHFFNSRAWQEMMETLKHLYDFYRVHGFHRVYKEFIAALDPEGESNAYKVLDLKDGASDAEIRGRCRLLSRKFHPDKHKDGEKEDAQKQFIAVQQACDILDKVRKRRSKNSRSEL